MAITLDGTSGITTPAVTNNGAYTGDGVSFADGTPSNTLVTTTGGNVGIGTNNPALPLTVQSGASTQIRCRSTTTGYRTSWGIDTSGNTTIDSYNDTGAAYTPITFNGNLLKFSISGTEAARIDSSGNLLLNTTSLVKSYSLFSIKYDGVTKDAIDIQMTSSAGTFLSFFNSSGTGVGYIYSAGTTTAYNTTSDYRLKDNVAPMTGALAKVQALKPCTYTWKSTGEQGEGFIAHELAEVIPDAVTGEKDAVNEDGSIKPQGIDTSFLVATLTAAIQELKAELDTVKTELATLKGTANGVA